MVGTERMNRKKYSGHDISLFLEQDIVENSLMPGVKLPTGIQLAQRYGVSLKTADRAVGRLVDKGLVIRTRGSGSYVKSNRRPAQKLRIALFYWKQPLELAELNSAAYDSFNNQLLSELTEHGFVFDRFEDNPFDKEHSRIFELPLMKYDVVIAVAGIQDVADRILRSTKAQVILITDDKVRRGPWHQVVYDYHPGFSSALEFFRKLGYGKFFIASANGETAEHRIEAIRKVAADIGIPEKNLMVYQGKCEIVNSQILSGNDCANHYLKNRLHDHAILSTGDFVTFGMLDVFAKNGLKPGTGFKLISYDNMESRLDPGRLRLGISGITHPLEFHVKATITLLENITRKHSEQEYYQTYFVPAKELVLRKTT